MINPSSINNKSAVIFSVVVAVFIFTIASLIANTKTNILSEATWPTNYPPRLSLSCQDCAANQLNRLCFNRLRKTSWCASTPPIYDPYSTCVSCPGPTLTGYPTLTSYPRVTPTWYPKPTCIPMPPDCGQIINGQIVVCSPPAGGWYCPPPRPSIYPEPTCMPPPPCVYTEPRCLLPEPIGGWCPITPTTSTCLQVLTPARNTYTKECRMFPTSCLPDGWIKDATCFSENPSPYPTRIWPTTTPYPTRIWPSSYVCPTPPYCAGRLETKTPESTSGYPCPLYYCLAQ